MENNYRKTPKKQNNLGIRPLSVEEVLKPTSILGL